MTTIEELVNQLETSSNNNSRKLPATSVDLYRLGRILYQTAGVDAEACFEGIPSTYLQTMLEDLTNALEIVISNRAIEDIRIAAQSISGLYQHSATCCRYGFSNSLCSNLTQVYDTLIQQKTDDAKELCTNLLATLDSLLCKGLMSTLPADDEEALSLLLQIVQTLISDDKNTMLGDMLIKSEYSILSSIRERFSDTTPQLDYLLKMMEGASKSGDFVTMVAKAATTTNGSKSTSRASNQHTVDGRTEIQRRIQQVKEVLPNLGDGFVEAALSQYQGDVSRTVAALLESESDPSTLALSLQLLDKKLPARKRETAQSTQYQLDDAKARQVNKERLAAMDKQQEEQEYALTSMNVSEYNDDYDDQYDDIDPGVGGSGGTYDDVNLDTVRLYNRVARDAEKEDQFWEENRNTNRQQGKGKSNGDANNGKAFRGPDKIKGGRAIGADGKVLPRQRGGKKGKATQQDTPQQGKTGSSTTTNGESGDPTDMSKIQQRRKNNNKAKIGNHHRKDRSLKKSSAGM